MTFKVTDNPYARLSYSNTAFCSV